jgi:hypothetical protein
MVSFLPRLNGLRYRVDRMLGETWRRESLALLGIEPGSSRPHPGQYNYWFYFFVLLLLEADSGIWQLHGSLNRIVQFCKLTRWREL